MKFAGIWSFFSCKYSNLIQFNLIKTLHYFIKCILPLAGGGTLNYYLPSQKGTVGDQCDSEEPMSFPNTFSIVFRMKTPEWAP